jgi:hypothetical protein
MNNFSPIPTISTIEDLKAERLRLTTLISQQKNLVRHDMDLLKEEMAQKLHPVAKAADFVKKIASPETRTASLLQIGSTMLIEALVRKYFAKSNLVVQMVVPNLVKNYSTHLLYKLARTIAENRNKQIQAASRTNQPAVRYTSKAA